MWGYELLTNTTTLICVQIHFMFCYIFNEFGHIYHGKSGQPFSKQGPITTDN